MPKVHLMLAKAMDIDVRIKKSVLPELWFACFMYVHGIFCVAIICFQNSQLYVSFPAAVIHSMRCQSLVSQTLCLYMKLHVLYSAFISGKCIESQA